MSKMKKLQIGDVAVIDMVELPEYGIIIADYFKRIHVLDIDNPSAKTEISLDGKPYGVATVDSHTIAVSVDHKHIQILDMRSNNIKETINVIGNTEFSIWGLSYFENIYYLAAKDRILHISDNSTWADDLLTVPKGFIVYLKIYSGKLYFTNYTDSSFTCASLKGETLFEIKTPKLKGPYGFTLLLDEKFAVVDWMTDRVHKIENDGSSSEIVLKKSDGIFKPRVIIYENKQKSLLIACNGGKSLVQTRRECSTGRESVSTIQ